MGMKYTTEQQKVIDLHNRNLLVSAAAGSGKTAVLVERIIQMISDDKNPVDIDRLLVVTFTKAAASEMKERISRAIEQKLVTEPDNKHLQKQATLLHNALITTIDSFCLFVVKNNFNDIGLDPNFRVADEGESKLLMQDSLAEVMEEFFAEGNEEFYQLLEAFCPDGKERKIEELVRTLYQYAESYPFPEEWLLNCLKSYEIKNVDEMGETGWMQFLQAHLERMLSSMISEMQKAIDICDKPDGPLAYRELFVQEMNDLITMRDAKSYEKMGKIARLLENKSLPRTKNNGAENLRETAKEIRSRVREGFKSICEEYFFASPDQIIEDLKISGALAGEFVRLTIAFLHKFNEKKREKKIVDFNDIEHMALKILIEKDGDFYKPTRTAEDYQEYFEEILIDEYQDSNLVQEYLLKSISKESTGKNNRFMVGDVKQSIYRFRLARPEIFMEKYDTYDVKDSATQRIDLSRNFRSRKEVLDTVNYVFYRVMQKSLGNVMYDDAAALYYGANYPTPESIHEKEDTFATEIALLDTMGGNKEEAKKCEARYIANRINQLVGKFPVTDLKTGVTRPAEYRDIAILLRVTSGWEETFKSILEEEGIPVYFTSKTGYFSTTEIQTLLNVLRVLNNPYQDIPLYGVLKSVFGSMTDEEIALLKNQKGHLYTKLVWATSNEDVKQDLSPEVKDKCAKVVDMIERYRALSVYTPIHELLIQLMEEYHYYEWMGALSGGAQRKANIDMLVQKAIDFGKTSYRGLFHFNRYIEQLLKYDVDYGEVSMADENANLVRIMTIHKSKGLEFPICFVAGNAKEFNLMDYYKPLLMDIDLCISCKVIDSKKRLYADSLYRNVMETKGILDSIGEEMRVLYVAMTRAKEKLILTAASKNMEKKVYKILNDGSNKSVGLPYEKIAGAKSHLDFILHALAGHSGVLELLGIDESTRHPLKDAGLTEPLIKMYVLTMEELEGGFFVNRVDKHLQREELSELLYHPKKRAIERDDALYDKLNRKFDYRYAHTRLSNLYTKTTVSELKKKAMEEQDDYQNGRLMFEEEKVTKYIPSFVEAKKEATGTKRGSAYHRVLELIPLGKLKSIEEVKTAIHEMVTAGRMEADYELLVDAAKILKFTNSSLGLRMLAAEEKKLLFREQPFVMGLFASEVSEEFPKDETVLIQGIIDVYFEEDGELIVADYKTDRVDKPEDLITRYQAQLDYYARSLEQMTGKKVKEKIIYSLFFEREIAL